MPKIARRSAFFDDRYTDARMRALIARFARLSSYVTLATAPLLANGRALLALLANASLALLVTVVVERWRLLDQATDRQLQALLLMYAALIANSTGLADGRAAPYVLMQALPVFFAAVFFTGSARYWVAVVVAAEHAAVLALYGTNAVRYDLVVLALCLIVAHFGAQVSAVLREAVAANRALHSVLEVTNDAPGSESLPDIGLAAAISVVGWDGGAVILRDGDLLHVVALHGVSSIVRNAYERRPIHLDDTSMAAQIVQTGESRYVADVPAFFGEDSALARDGIACMIGVPLNYHGETIGALILDNRSPRTPDSREWERLRQVGEQLGLALGNMRAYLREAQVAEDLRELNRRKDAFLATISHELRTPATTIMLAARTLRDAGARLDPDDRAYAHDLLVRRSEELSRLIESLLDEALAESAGVRLELASIDWLTDLERWADMAKQQTGRTVTLVLPDHPVTTMADPAKTERVVTNLLSNAAKFSAAGTPIRLRLLTDDEWVYVTVTDEGVGIPDGEQDRIFEAFYQVESHATRERGGFGIGLSLARRFAEAHGGTIAVVSTPGVGSTFTMKLPRAVVPLGRAGRPPAVPATRGAQRG